jgi:DNA-binding MarR family transcriptional regulator
MSHTKKPSDRARVLGDFVDEAFAKMGELQPGTITLNELRVGNTILRLLRRSEECSFTLVGALTSIPNGTVSRTIAKLIERGRIKESVDEDDRRKRKLELTPAGEQLLEQWSDWIDEVSEHITINDATGPSTRSVDPSDAP